MVGVAVGDRNGVELGGIEVARALAVYGTAILFISGDSGLDRDPAVQAIGPAAVLEKPCMPDRLIAVLQKVAADVTAAGAS